MGRAENKEGIQKKKEQIKENKETEKRDSAAAIPLIGKQSISQRT